ncbi:MAG: CHAT domain-containing protein [Bryobacterales bacterium]|nr:CHAT domain-containing protein [Bryobacterales bacterium]
MRSVWATLLCLSANAADILAPGQAVVRQLNPGSVHQYSLPPQPSFFDLEIDPRGTRLDVTAGPLRLDLSDGPARPTGLCWIADSHASPGISIRSLEVSASRSYSIRLTARPPNEADQARAKGCRLQAEAARERDFARKAQILAEAREAFHQAGDWHRIAEVSTPLGQALWELGKTSESIAAHLQAVAAWEKAGQPGRKAGAMAILSIGYGFLPDKRSQAIPTSREAATLARDSGDAVSEAMALINLADWQTRQGGSADARALATRAIDLNRKAAYRAGEAMAWNSLARWQMNTSAAEAEASDLEALRLRRELQDEAGEAQSLSNLSTVHSALGNETRAIEMMEHALEIRKRVASPAGIANTQHNLGVNYVRAGEFDRGVTLFEEAIRVWRSLGHKLGLAATLAEMAQVELSEGSLDRAERLYREALALNREIGNRRAESNVLRGLGAVLQHKRLFDAAVEMRQQSARIAHDGKFQMEESRALTGLGLTYAGMGRLQDAISQLRQAKEVSRTVSLPDLLLAQIGLANVLREARDVPASMREFEEAEALAARIRGSRDQLAISAGKTLSLLAAGDVPGARSESDRALGLVEELRENLAGGLARAEQLDRRHRVFHAAASVRMRAGEVAAAFEASERGHARSLADLLAGVSNPREFNDSAEERKLRVALSAKSALLNRLLGSQAKPPETDPIRAEITRLEDQYNALKNRMARAHPEWARSAQPASLAGIQQQLGVREAILEFLLGADRSYAWLVSRGGVSGVELPPRSEIEAAVVEIRKRMQPGQVPMPIAPPEIAALRALLFRGAAAQGELAKFRKVYIVPDGDLHFAPFAALLSAPTIELAILPSASVLTHLPPAAPVKRELMVFADPVYEAIDARLRNPASVVTTRAEEAHRFPRRRFSGQEAETIRKLSGAVPFTGFAASRTRFDRTSFDRYGVLHFATHAVTYPRQPELSAIVLSLQDDRGRPVDGFVRMYDVARLRLQSPLVVLSACDTAVGRRLEGEGPLGISRTFLAAGASGVVATLWAVDDAATAELMAAFYRELLKRRSTPAAALRQAQLSLRAQSRWRNPYFWAGFIYIGR